MSSILPGSTLGILGGGQLGRMFCVAAQTMGYKVVVLDPDTDSPAGVIANKHIQADYADTNALDGLAKICSAVTTEFENVPADSLEYLSKKIPVSPSAESLRVAQNRDREKSFAQSAGLLPVPYHSIHNESDFDKAIEITGFPAILKSSSMGYDGKGQAVIETAGALKVAFDSMGSVECVLEKKIELACEVSAIVARNSNGEIASYPVAENEHRDGILHMSTVPARVDQSIVDTVTQQAIQLVEALKYVGILAVEFFIATDGTIYFNEMAPRPHNSGHYTLDSCLTSQFEQQVRMMCNLVPGNTALTSPVVMVNLLGDLWPVGWNAVLSNSHIKLHLYGKKEARAGRKMGHMNVLSDNVESAHSLASSIFSDLT